MLASDSGALTTTWISCVCGNGSMSAMAWRLRGSALLRRLRHNEHLTVGGAAKCAVVPRRWTSEAEYPRHQKGTGASC